MSEVRVSAADGIVEIVLQRPPVNACSYTLYASLKEALETVGNSTDVAVAIYRGEGKGFCAGADVREFLDLTPETRRARHDMVSGVMKSLFDVPIPVICQIHGFAIGAGLAMASLCDFRIASEDAVFAMPEIDRGTVGGGGAFFYRLGMRSGQIREMLYTGRRYTAAEALEMGLVEYVVSADKLDAKVRELAERIASKSLPALKLTKKAANEAESLPNWHDGYVASHPYSAQLTGGADAKEGVRSFLEGRQPKYGGQK